MTEEKGEAPSPEEGKDPSSRPSSSVSAREGRYEAWSKPVARLLLALLALEFLLGLWTNVYASGTSYPPTLGVHDLVGYLLGLLSILALVFAVMSGRRRLMVPSALVLVGVLVAAVGGMAFLANPNDAIDSFVMGVGFLVAFTAGSFLHSAVERGRAGRPAPDPWA